jgi:hypothetical protein
MSRPVPQVAAEALEILERDGWCKGTVSSPPIMVYLSPVLARPGSHCLGGAVNLAARGAPECWADEDPCLAAAARVIAEQYPEIPASLGEGPPARLVTYFNDRADTTYPDVRRILEKLAVQEET